MPSLSRYRDLADMMGYFRRKSRAACFPYFGVTTDVYIDAKGLPWGRKPDKMWGLGEHGVWSGEDRGSRIRGWAEAKAWRKLLPRLA